MKQFKMSARGTISCDVAKKLEHRRHARLKKSNDLELYNKEGTAERSGDKQPEKASASQKLMKTSGEWKARDIEYLRMGGRQDIQVLFSSSHDNDINCYEYSDQQARVSKKDTKRKQQTEQGSWKELREWKLRGPVSGGLKWKDGRGSRKRVELTWDELVDQKTDTSHDNLNLVYCRRKKQTQRSTRFVDIYKVQSKPTQESGQGRARQAPSTMEKTDIFAQFDEIQAKYNIDLAKTKPSQTGRRKPRNPSPSAHLPPRKLPARKLLRLKPSQQLKLEGLISEESPGVEPQSNLSQYQSLNYSVDPMVKKKETSASQKKFKDFSQQMKRRPLLGSRVLHVRNKSSATLIENKFASRIRPKKVKKISLNEQRSMHSEMLSNLREQSYRYISRGNPRNYFQKISKKTFKLGVKGVRGPGRLETGGEAGERSEKDLRIKEYEPFVKSVETESASQANVLEQIELKRETLLKEGLENKFASHHELFDEGGFARDADPQARKQSLKGKSGSGSVYNESLKPKRKGREHSEPKDLVKKSLQHKKKSVYKRSILNYTKPKNRKIKRKKDKKYLKDFSTLRAGESFKGRDRLGKRDHARPHLAQRRRGLFRPEAKPGTTQEGAGPAQKGEDKPVSSMTLNAVQTEGDKKGPVLQRPRHYIVNDILEKKGFDLNMLSGKNGKNAKKGAPPEFLFRPKQERQNSKSVKISLNNIRSSVAHLEKALAKEKNRLKNICNLTKAVKSKKMSKRKPLNLNLKTKENCDAKSPKQTRPAEAPAGEEPPSKKKALGEKKKKKTGKLSTKNLLNKFNKMSYFEFKKNMKGRRPDKALKRPKRGEERPPAEQEWGPLAVSKVKKTALYER